MFSGEIVIISFVLGVKLQGGQERCASLSPYTKSLSFIW